MSNLVALMAAILTAAPAESAASSSPAPAYGPALPPRPAPALPPSREESCDPDRDQTGPNGEIIVCVERPQGYRLNPDVMEAKRAVRQQNQRPKTEDNLSRAPTLCEYNGGCPGLASLDILNTALIAGQMALKAAQGENVAKMFVTNPQASEYELYLQAKREREARELAERAAAIVRDVKQGEAARGAK